jgi:hypothetical protein
VVADEVGQELRGFGFAGVGGEGVHSVRGFVEALARLEDCLGFAFHLRADGALHDVAQDGAGMAVSGGGFSGSVIDFEHGGLQAVALEVRQGLGEHLADALWHRLGLSGGQAGQRTTDEQCCARTLEEVSHRQLLVNSIVRDSGLVARSIYAIVAVPLL